MIFRGTVKPNVSGLNFSNFRPLGGRKCLDSLASVDSKPDKGSRDVANLLWLDSASRSLDYGRRYQKEIQSAADVALWAMTGTASGTGEFVNRTVNRALGGIGGARGGSPESVKAAAGQAEAA
jgi:hypothetical protein